jgi:hypothetical protein
MVRYQTKNGSGLLASQCHSPLAQSVLDLPTIPLDGTIGGLVGSLEVLRIECPTCGRQASLPDEVIEYYTFFPRYT